MKKQGPALDTLPEMWLRNKPEFPKTFLTERRVATDKLIRRYGHICLAKVRVELVFDSSDDRDFLLSASRPALGPIQYPSQWVSGFFTRE